MKLRRVKLVAIYYVKAEGIDESDAEDNAEENFDPKTAELDSVTAIEAHEIERENDRE